MTGGFSIRECAWCGRPERPWRRLCEVVIGKRVVAYACSNSCAIRLIGEAK